MFFKVFGQDDAELTVLDGHGATKFLLCPITDLMTLFLRATVVCVAISFVLACVVFSVVGIQQLVGSRIYWMEIALLAGLACVACLLWALVNLKQAMLDRHIVLDFTSSEFSIQGGVQRDGVPLWDAFFYHRSDLNHVERRSSGIALHISGASPIFIGTWCRDSAVLEPLVKFLSQYAPTLSSHIPTEDDSSSNLVLSYQPRRQFRCVRCRQTSSVLECMIDWAPTYHSSHRPGWRAAQPGFAEFVDVFWGRMGTHSRSSTSELPIVGLVITSSELWILTRRVGELSKRTIYPRTALTEFRLNRFDGGIYVRIAGEHLGNLNLVGNHEVARQVHDWIASRLTLEDHPHVVSDELRRE